MNKMIKKIELDLGGKTVSLTPEQAKNLKVALDELFGKEVIREIVKEKDWWPAPYMPYMPYVPTYHRPYYWEWQFWTITCDTIGNLTGSMSYCANTETLKLTA